MLTAVKRTYWNRVLVVTTCWLFLVILWVTSTWPYRNQSGAAGYDEVVSAISTLADFRVCFFQIVSVLVILGLTVGFRKRTSAASLEQTIAMFFDEACSFTLNFATLFLLSGIATLVKPTHEAKTVLIAVAGCLANLVFSRWAWHNATPSEMEITEPLPSTPPEQLKDPKPEQHPEA